MFDSTPDVSHVEQLSQIIRYVQITDGQCTIEESFVDFIESHKKTGQGLAMEVIEKLQADGLDINDCRGQRYDNVSTMSGKYKGVQAQIRNKNSLARYVPCMAHTLNLVGVHDAEVSPMMITFFGTVQKIFTYFSGSTGRWEKLMSVLETTLKGHTDTRWSSKRQAVTSVNNQFPKVYGVLKSISGDSSLNSETVEGATSLLKHIDFNFICLLEFWSGILIKIDFVNKSLQAKDIIINIATKLLESLSSSLND